jgi:hypothetical protein
MLMKKTRKSTIIISFILILSLLSQIYPVFHVLENHVKAQPEITDNGDFTITAIWDFDDPTDFDLYNTTLANGEVNLSLPTFYWNQSTQSDFDLGTHSSTNSTSTGDVVLAEEMKDVNIVNNGEFISDVQWSFISGNDIQSLHNSTAESAELGYKYKTGPNMIYLNPPTGEDDGFLSNWYNWGIWVNENSSATTDIGYHNQGGIDKKKRSYFYFDISEIPVTAIIDDVSFYAWLQSDSANSTHLFDIHAMDIPRLGSSTPDLYIDSGNGSLYLNDSDTMKSGTPSGYQNWNLGLQAVGDLQGNLSRGWFGIGLHEEGDDDKRSILLSVNAASNHPQLNVSYTTVAAVSIDEISYVNQTFYKPNVTPNDPTAAHLNFDFKVDKFLNTTSELIVEIDGTPVWGPYSISSTTSWTPISLDVGQYLTASKNYEISLQLHMDVNIMTEVECVVKFDNINITTWGYAWLGTFTSDIFDPQTDVFWDKISWNQTAMSETDLSIKTQNSPDGSSWDPLSPPYSNPNGEQIIPGQGRKMRYSVDLLTTNYTKTPKLHDVNISYKKYCSNGTIQMNTDYEPANLRNWGTFTWIEQKNGQSITYWYSIDSGNSWIQTLDGNLSGVNTTISGKIRFKSEFVTGSGIITPTLYEWNLTFEISELTTLFGSVNPSGGYVDSWYNFTVRYSDPEDDAPDQITLNITQGTSHLGVWDMFEVNASDTNHIDGKWYYFNDTGFLRGSNYTFHFAAQDPSLIWSIGTNISGPFVLNSPPKITTTNKLGAQGGVLYYNDYEADDLEDAAILDWGLSTNASWLSIDPISGNLSGTPLLNDEGFYWVNVRVGDLNGGTDETNFTLTVGDTEPPIADAGADATINEDDIYQFNGTGSTDNIGIMNYTWDFGDLIGYGPIPTHIYTRAGVFLAELTVIDVLGNEDTDTVKITVLNRPPSADAGADRTVNEGELVNFNASNSSDTPSDFDSLIYLWDFDEDGEFDDAVGINVTYMWNEAKSVTVTLRVKDDDGAYSDDPIVVNVINVAPVVDIGDYYTQEKDSELVFIASITHPGDFELLFRWDWENDGIWDTNFTAEYIIKHAWDEEGEYTLVVQVYDGVEYVTDSALVEITRHNIPPQLGDLGSRQIRYNNPYTVNLAQFITDDDSPLSSMIVTTDDPGHISINGVNITLIYNESWVGKTIDVQVTVSDGIASDSAILTVLITQNFPPTLIKPFTDIEFNEDENLINVFNLNDHFIDNDTTDKLAFTFDSNDQNLIVEIDNNGLVSFKTTPNWAGSTMVSFQAEDPSGAISTERIFITVIPTNDEPFILKQIPSSFTTIGEDGNWTVDLDDFFFDVDNFDLTFTCNYPEIKIDPVTHEATWVPGDKKQLNNVKFTASDGEHSVSLDPVDLRAVEENPDIWLLLILLIIIFAAIFVIYREMQYRYSVEEVFLVDNAGVLLVHLSQWESKAIDAKLVSGMLTAVQEFVKDSFRGSDNGPQIKMDEGALGKLEYGDFQIVIERGTYSFLSAVISGNDNKRLRKRMKDVVDEFETKYSKVLADWDGDMARFDGAERIVGRLLKNQAGMKMVTESKVEETTEEIIQEEIFEDIPDLPSGDFGNIPSYYEETDGGEYEEEGSNQK